ncbi:MAG: hypothetical protein HDS48_05560 [Bacteroides sp.]|nr:hypothetical protein [Bacteroides sp.]
MSTTVNIKRKNIDLPEWFNNSENIASIKRGIQEMEAGKGRAYSMEEIRNLLGV